MFAQAHRNSIRDSLVLTSVDRVNLPDARSGTSLPGRCAPKVAVEMGLAAVAEAHEPQGDSGADVLMDSAATRRREVRHYRQIATTLSGAFEEGVTGSSPTASATLQSDGFDVMSYPCEMM